MADTYSVYPPPPIFGKIQQQGVSPTNNQVPAFSSSDDMFKPQSISSILTPVTSNIVFNDNVKLFFGTDSDVAIYYNGTDLVIDGDILENTFTFLSNVAGVATFLKIKRPVNTVSAIVSNLQGLGLDSASNETNYSAIATVIRDNTDGSEDGSLQLRATLAGVVTTFLELNNPATLAHFLQDVSIASLKKLYLDGGGDTYIYESSANVVRIFVGGNQVLQVSASELQLIAPSSASETIFEIGQVGSVAWHNKLEVTTGDYILMIEGGEQVFEVTRSGTSITNTIIKNGDLAIQSTKKFYFDNVGDTYIYESSANILTLVVGGLIALECTNSIVRFAGYSATSDPTTANLSDGYCMIAENTTTGVVKLWFNYNGTMKSVTLS